MAILSDRLDALAKQINEGETMADIGTDHGFLPIYLHTQGISPKVVMTDVSAKSLSKARENGEGVKGLPDSSYRCGDGLAPIQPGEVDAVVLAGMGGMLMVEILTADLPKSRSIGKFVLQPRNHAEALRRFLALNGFSIAREVLVREGRHLCEIIVASPNQTKPMTPDDDPNRWTDAGWPVSDIRWEVPPMYAESHDPLTTEYLHKKFEREKRVMRDLHKAKTLDGARLQQQEVRIAYLKSLMKKRGVADEI